MLDTIHKTIIIGAGPAGLTAAIYAARAHINPLVIAGPTPGGELMLTSEVENYPGFPEGIMGPDLMERFQKQAERFGAKIVDETVKSVDFSKRPFSLTTEKYTYKCQTVILALGTKPRWLGLESEQRLRGKGVSACAICDGAFFRDKTVVVVGGGDSAMEESTFLTKFAKKVIVIHRSETLSASKIMQDRAKTNPKISFEYNYQVVEVLGEEKVRGVRVKNTKTGEEKEIACDGMFLAIGHIPNTELFKGVLDLDERGYVVTVKNTQTSILGVFAAGDIADSYYRQAVTAAGFGCMAAIDVERFLDENRIDAR